ncbi:formin-like protein 18 [Onychostruthus taczanowskii]|uniref:formin-like protein 18 n=1 Tax=Onychostruthus taczanowskii TaxID=356909 RepID=UPI001B80DBE1|nr:formin-like protein 18 [Onychostruthus taczanowskii]
MIFKLPSNPKHSAIPLYDSIQAGGDCLSGNARVFGKALTYRHTGEAVAGGGSAIPAAGGGGRARGAASAPADGDRGRAALQSAVQWGGCRAPSWRRRPLRSPRLAALPLRGNNMAPPRFLQQSASASLHRGTGLPHTRHRHPARPRLQPPHPAPVAATAPRHAPLPPPRFPLGPGRPSASHRPPPLPPPPAPAPPAGAAGGGPGGPSAAASLPPDTEPVSPSALAGEEHPGNAQPDMGPAAAQPPPPPAAPPAARR